MDLSLSTRALRDLLGSGASSKTPPLHTMLPVVAQAGFGAVEIDLSHLAGCGTEDLHRIRQLMDKLGLRAGLIQSRTDFTSGRESASAGVESAQRMLSCARELKARGIELSTGELEAMVVGEEPWDRTVRCVQRIADSAITEGYCVSCDSGTGFLRRDVPAMLEFVQQVDRPNVGLTFHPFDFRPDPLPAMRAILPHLLRIQVVNGIDGVPSRLGQGDVDYAMLIVELARLGYAGAFTLESLIGVPDSVAAEERQWVAAILARVAEVPHPGCCGVSEES